MNFDLQTEFEINGKICPIRDKGDYRVILDVIAAYSDQELEELQRLECALIIFYENYEALETTEEIQIAAEKMMEFISGGETTEGECKAPIMNWNHDFRLIAPPVNRALGYDIRTPGKYTHWWTFLGGYMEIGESAFSNVISIRKKLRKGENLEKWEQEYYRENQKMINLPLNLTAEDEEWLGL